MKPVPENRCGGCNAKDGEISFLRERIRELEKRIEEQQTKFMALIPPAMDSYNRLQLTHAAQLRPEVMEGLSPASDVLPDDEGFGEFLNQFDAPQPQARRRG